MSLIIPPSEAFNPNRRYKWHRPRQSTHGYIEILTPTNFGTVSLYNQSSGAYYLVIRDFTNSWTGAVTSFGFGVQKGQIGNVGGSTFGYIPGDGAQPGQMCSLDNPSQIGTFFTSNLSFGSGFPLNWVHDFPAQVLPPGWSFFWQTRPVGISTNMNISWEAITADELDWVWD